MVLECGYPSQCAGRIHRGLEINHDARCRGDASKTIEPQRYDLVHLVASDVILFCPSLGEICLYIWGSCKRHRCTVGPNILAPVVCTGINMRGRVSPNNIRVKFHAEFFRYGRRIPSFAYVRQVSAKKYKPHSRSLYRFSP